MAADLFHVAQLAATQPAEFLIASAWQGLLLTSGAWLGLKAARKLAPRTRFVLWMIVFLLAAFLPFVTLVDRPAASSAVHAAGHLSTAHLDANWAIVFAGAWLLTSLFSLGRLLVSAYRLHRLARTATPVDLTALDPELRVQFERSGAAPIALCLSSRIDSPMLIGFLRPAIVIPEWLWQKLTPSEMSQVVMHELAHLERRDDWTNLLQKLFRALFPLNPALLFAERQLCWEREMACDDAVLEAAVTPREYATCLTSLAEKRLLRHAQSLAPGAWRRRSELAERVHRILKGNRTLGTLSARPVIFGFLALYLSAGFVLTRSPRLVTFLPSPTRTAMVSNSAIAANDSAEFAGRTLNGDTRGLTAPRVEQASFHTAVSRPVVRVAKAKWTTRHADLRRRAVIKHKPRVVKATLNGTGQPAFSQTLPNSDARIVFAVFEFSSSLPQSVDSRFSYSQITAIRSGGSWIIVQL
jgi:beta-lactamase regulating signal transducer with metallopeptidase domain